MEALISVLIATTLIIILQGFTIYYKDKQIKIQKEHIATLEKHIKMLS